MPRKKKVNKDLQADFIDSGFKPFSPDDRTTVSVDYPVEFVLNCELGRNDLNENFRKIQEAINELKKK